MKKEGKDISRAEKYLEEGTKLYELVKKGEEITHNLELGLRVLTQSSDLINKASTSL
ncbi:MAG: hypothetical protein ACE5WD_13970 [Candidatus Aminicenantia bacterium]